NESVAASRSDSFQVLVTFVVDPGLVTAASADCDLVPGEDGTGLLNSAGVSGGVPPQWDEDCRDIPRPSVTITKVVSQEATPTGNVNEYTIAYQVVVENTSDVPAFYDLRDTLKYGEGAQVTDVVASYVDGDGETGTPNYGSFDGQTDYLIIEEESVAALRADSFQVLVTFTVDPGTVTDESANCNLLPGEEGTGLLNSAGVSGGVPPQWDDDCEEIPRPSVLIEKTVSQEATPTGNANEYTIAYKVEVLNTSDVPAFYDLRDTLKYGTGATITDVVASYLGGDGETGTSNYTNFDGQSDYLITLNESVAATRADSFQVLVTFTVDPGMVTDESANCNLLPGEEGTGLLNSAGVSGGVPPQWDEGCDEIPRPSVLIAKTVSQEATPTGNVNEYTIAYKVEVMNTSDVPAFYDLRDTLKYGTGATITDVVASYLGGDGQTGTSNYTNFDGQSDYLITLNESVAATRADSFQVLVTFVVDPGLVTDESGDCDLLPGEE